MNEGDPARTLNESRRMICLDESVEDFECVRRFAMCECFSTAVFVVVCCGSVCREAKLINNSKTSRTKQA